MDKWIPKIGEQFMVKYTGNNGNSYGGRVFVRLEPRFDSNREGVWANYGTTGLDGLSSYFYADNNNVEFIPVAPPHEYEYIIYNRMSDRPPTVIFQSEDRAYEVAQSMATKHGGKFYVCRLEGFATPAVPVPPTVVKYTGGNA